ncbi:SusD family protein [Parapedobacter luteus]|uniref:SusD family protein n=1 Tax=Parapedobacter luteus TaxID=623280 RepID=A0A1T5CUE5_9SPHI|nr:RagB/SusD family nutrient uptake outer membrane protein [Parapedobacter luteus]SKB62810.1 SusD family protein [Parapedobacter luteus]
MKNDTLPIIKYLAVLLGTPAFFGCSDFLGVKPQSSLALLTNLAHYQAILNNETRLNGSYPFAGDYASDYYYLSEADFLSRDETGRNNYTWGGEPAHQNNWYQAYGRVYDTNVILASIDEAALGNMHEENRNSIKGSAYFLRAYNFYHLAQLFAPPYQQGNNDGLLGIPLRLSPDINERSYRATLDETYARIIADLKAAVPLLPDLPAVKTLPSKAAAYAALSRVYLTMQHYAEAGAYADSSLRLQPALIDYNDLDTMSAQPQFPALNEEVIFHATCGNFSAILSNSRAGVDTTLYGRYYDDDLRKSLFYRVNTQGVLGFYGNYDGSTSSSLFFGLATDEMYLTRAECYARMGNTSAANDDLSTLLSMRYKRATYEKQTFQDGEELLAIILQEREKELAFRAGIRWADLRRLNLDPRFAKALYRRIGSQVYTLEPNSPRYTFKIPYDVIRLGSIEQNP